VNKIIFSKNATDALLSQASYIYQLTLDVNKADIYLDEMEDYIRNTLRIYPNIGRPAPELGLNIRKLVYKRYSILYRIENIQIEILSIYRENLPNI